jgi:putative transposase
VLDGEHKTSLHSYDTAPMESVFHTLKLAPVHQPRWATPEAARRDLLASGDG